MIIKDLKEHIAYTTYDGVEFEIVVDGLPKNLTNTVITAAIRYGSDTGKIVKTLTIGSGITITDAVAGKFVWDELQADFEPGTYHYDIRFTDGAKSKIYVGGVWPLVQFITPKNA